MPKSPSPVPFSLAVLVALSGAASLMHEMLWIRGLGLHFGTTTPAVATVVATFMAGLGIGNLWFGRMADRSARPLRLYARLELVIAVSACVVSLFVLRGGAALDALARVCARTGELSTLATGSVFGLLMLVPATAMGGTLPVLTRALARHGHAGRAISTLYACNTIGAVVGALLPDFLLIARYGYTLTACVAAMCNLLVALVVFRFREATMSPPSAADDATPAVTRADMAALLLTACSGFCAMGLEVLWSRTLQHWAAALVTSFAVLLAVYLTTFSLGTSLAQRAAPRSSQPLQVASMLLGLSGILTVLPIWLAPSWRDLERVLWPRDPSLRRVGLFKEAVDALLHATFLEAGACFVLGTTFPFVAAAWLARDRPGARSGQLFFVNGAFGVLGALMMGFVWLPQLGEQGSYAAIALLLATVAVSCAWLASSRAALRAGPGMVGAIVSLGLVLAIVLSTPTGQLYRAHFRNGGAVLAIEEGSSTTAAAAARYLYGEPYYVELLTPGISMSSTRADARRYMAVMAHAAMFSAKTARRALLICYGVGNTAAALLSHASLERLDVVDLSREVLALSPWFAKARGSDPLRDPRTRVFVDDGRHHLITREEQYDVITAEPPPPNYAGVVNLYSRELYRYARQRLSPGGIITQWLPVFQLADDDVRAMIAAFVAELPHTALLYGHGEQLILIGSVAPFGQLPAAELAQRMADPAVLRNLLASDIRSPYAVLGATLQTDAELRRQVSGVTPLSDARPDIQYPFADLPAEDRAHPGYTARFAVRPSRALALVGDAVDPAPLMAAADATARAIGAVPLASREPPEERARELALVLQPALDVHADDEALWLLLAADRDRVTLAEQALSREHALELISLPRTAVERSSQLPRYLVLQDALWVLARRAYYARDYTRALTWLGKITPEPELQKLHAWLTEQAGVRGPAALTP